MQDNDACFISDKLKGKLDLKSLAHQSTENYDTPYQHEFDNHVDTSNMVQIMFNDDTTIYGILQNVIELKQTTKIKLHTNIEYLDFLLKNQINKIDIINNDTVLQTYKIVDHVKKCIKIINNQYIQLKLKFYK